MNYIILDLEATCWEKTPPGAKNEIIEIGAVKINAKSEIVDEYCAFVKPKLDPVLSQFCKDLTTITQEEIDQAETFDKVMPQFLEWINPQEDYLLCSWGFYDKNQLLHDCELHDLGVYWLRQHISVKHQYAKIKELKRPCGMAAALTNEGLSLDGTHHRGIDDARNIAKIFVKLSGKWSGPKTLEKR